MPLGDRIRGRRRRQRVIRVGEEFSSAELDDESAALDKPSPRAEPSEDFFKASTAEGLNLNQMGEAERASFLAMIEARDAAQGAGRDAGD